MVRLHQASVDGVERTRERHHQGPFPHLTHVAGQRPRARGEPVAELRVALQAVVPGYDDAVAAVAADDLVHRYRRRRAMTIESRVKYLARIIGDHREMRVRGLH